MVDWKTCFKGTKITVIGLGLLGRAVGDAEFLANMGAELIVTDLKTKEALASSVARLKECSNITFRFGEHRMEDFQNRDYILKSAGVPLDSMYIEEARKNTIPIKMSASWFAELAGIPIVGVTGTRGKTTVTYMLKEILGAAGKRVLLGGNVRGVSTVALLPEATEGSIGLFELDSWQLQGFGDANMSPHVAVFTNFLQDHMNYYHHDMERYAEDKAQIFLHQKPGDAFVLGAQAKESVFDSYRPPVDPVIADVSAITGWDIGVPGEHNRENAACAAVAAKALGIDEETCRRVLTDFRGVPGRLEFLREVNGVKIYNDTTSTTPEATLAALKALDPGESKNIVLIMGGADKGLDMHALLVAIEKHCKATVLIAGTGTDKIIRDEWPLTPGQEPYSDLSLAVTGAMHVAREGDIILFSPAFASFGMFINEFDRGDQFTALIKGL